MATPSCPDPSSLVQLLDNELPPEQQAELTQHLDGCPRCQQAVQDLASGGNSWADTATHLSQAEQGGIPEPALEQVVEQLAGASGVNDIQPATCTQEPAVPSSSGPAVTQSDAAPDGTEVLAFLGPSTKPGHLGRLGHYEVLAIVGKGGMGTVFKAFDDVLHRVVAIKMLAPELATSGTARQRFLREARAAAAVSHDHIVTIHAVEEGQQLPYLVMQYVDGVSLQDKVDRAGPLTVKEILRIGLQTASGLAAAHKQGLVHRDVKPANILLENGVERVKLTDFGLARAADDASLTKSGVIAGTPMYMSPEQADAQPVDHRSDLFSLGSVLYVMCTGRPPFRATSTMAVLRRVCDDTPRPIREVNPEVPEWLEAIIARLHAKDPAGRFQSAAEVGELLGQHLAHLQQPQVVPLPQPAKKVEPAPRRRRPIAVAGLALLLVAGILATYLIFRKGDDQSPMPKGTDKFFDALKREDIHPSLLALAGGGDPEQAPPELVAVLGDGRFCLPPGGVTNPMAQNADGMVLAVPNGTDVVLFEARTGKHLRTLPGARGGGKINARCLCVAFSREGKQLASGGRDPKVKVWNTRTGELVHDLQAPTNVIESVAFSPEGDRLAAGGGPDDGLVIVWDLSKGQEVFARKEHTSYVRSIDYSPDGKWLASAGADGVVKVWDAKADKLERTFQGFTPGLFLSVAFSLDGKRLAAGSDAELKVWNTETFAETLARPTPAGWVAFAPDGRTLFAGRRHNAGGVGVAQVTRWDVTSGKELPKLVLNGHGKVSDFAVYHLSTDGKTLFTMANAPPDPFVRAYDAETGKELFPRQGHEGVVYAVAISPDGRTLASGGADKKVMLWDLTKLEGEGKLPLLRVLEKKHTGEVIAVAFSPNGKLLASGSKDGAIVLWDVASGGRIKQLPGRLGNFSRVTFSPDGQTVAAGGNDGTVRLWEVPSGKPKDEIRGGHAGMVREVAFSPDGKLLASAGEDQIVRLWELPGGELLDETPKLGAIVTSVHFSPDGQTLAAGCDAPKSALRLWDISDRSNWKLKADLRGHTSHVGTFAFPPDGQLVATGSADGTVRFWDRTAADSSRVLTVGFGTPVHGVAFSPEGGYLATANENGTISIQRVPDFESWQRKERLAFEAWAKAIAGRKQVFQRTTSLAPGNRNFNFEDMQAKGPSLVVGFTVVTSRWPVPPNFLLIGSVRPIYLTAEGISDGKTCGPAACAVSSVRLEARPGYAVGGIVGKKDNAGGFKIVFMRIEGARLNPADRYETDWLGGPIATEEVTLGGDGRPVVGIYGQAGGMIDALGLVQLEVEEKK